MKRLILLVLLGSWAVTLLAAQAVGGQGGLGGSLVTKTVLVYGLLSSSGRADRGGRLVAYDKATGALVGAVALPGAPLGTPMTYAIRGKQYVALTLLGGQMVSLAIP